MELVKHVRITIGYPKIRDIVRGIVVRIPKLSIKMVHVVRVQTSPSLPKTRKCVKNQLVVKMKRF